MKKLILISLLALSGCHQKITLDGPGVERRIDLPNNLKYIDHTISLSNGVWEVKIVYKEYEYGKE